MTTQKDDLVFDIQELQTEIDEHVRKIIQLKSIIQVKEQQLNEIPITLERIIIECMIGYNSSIMVGLMERILDRVEVEFFPKLQQEAGDTEVYYKNKGWNNCLKELKGRMRE
jgi:molybdopterin converting factor small subunit